MAARKKEYQRKYRNLSAGYMEGNAARQLGDVWEDQRRNKTYESPYHEKQEQNKSLQGITRASLLTLTLAIAATVIICVEYLKLQVEVQQVNAEVLIMEKTLTAKCSENVAAYDEIDKTYDLDYVYKMAVGKYGMRYPNKNKVIEYQKSDEGYVRQYGDIPELK
jgi:cell division protein FtsL